MDVVSRCRKQKINLSLRDVLQSESIRHLAPTAGAGFASLQYEEKTDESFGLSPIQQLYFQSAKGYQGRSRFNQSMSLRLTQRTDCNTLESAIRRIIGQHSMLRARFSVNQDGTWQQRITTVRVPPLDTVEVDARFAFGLMGLTCVSLRKLTHHIAIEFIRSTVHTQHRHSLRRLKSA
jgi:hypothetical protein